MAPILDTCEGFDWDDGNAGKNWSLHRVTDGECEEIFFNLPLLVSHDERPGNPEHRYLALGRSNADRWLFTAFTIRRKLIRIISAREMTKSERRKYEEAIKRDPEI